MWFKKWFNEDYLKLYSHRTMGEASKQVDFIRRSAGCSGSKTVLDLACGTGRHSIAFGLKGHQVTGIDLSEALIAKARKRALEYEELNVSFLVADLFSLPDIGRFDLVANLFTSFGYFSDDQKNSQVFFVVRERLKDDGRFFLDFLHPYSVKQNLVEEESLLVDGEEVEVKRFIKDDCVYKQIQFPGRAYEERVKLYDRDVIEQMLSNAGLSVVNVWNDYLGNSWKKEGDRQLFLCIKNSG
ncbi:putative methyltransferase [Waddlia chondrophila 2032/99]|uniref:Putative methyltransferase n=2 Tax=Waddlia chondrophila TaxID=71667 RepID=D6YWK9_WADCW|nr:class I SAM-dependent methyltransferase [Waddlia chondrophila]ADI38520.1 putative methyltransferase [Waddlia chondrophila WSU 86-1044]CCB91602.1 putative methyltransferase [Waddlia chondrophila 2032/99]